MAYSWVKNKTAHAPTRWGQRFMAGKYHGNAQRTADFGFPLAAGGGLRHRMKGKRMKILWPWMWAAAWAASASGQYATPVRASWTEDSATTATITWDTSETARGTVRYGLTTNFTHIERDGGGVHRHAILLRGLLPGTKYHYEASSTDGFSQPASFRTAPAAGQPLHFVYHGDLNGGIDVLWAQSVSDRILLEDPQWVVQLGDMSDEAYNGAGFGTWTNFFQICSNELARFVFMPILGNHDDPGSADVPDHARGLFHRLFALPEPALGNAYYAYTVGNLRFICLNTEGGAAAQTNWLARELQAAANDSNITWVVAICHRPPYSQGGKEGWGDGKTNWSPLLTKYEADWLVTGHSHNYQRTVPIRGVRYLVAGGGGGYPYDSAVGEPMLSFATTCYHHVSAHVTGEVMQIRGVRSDGLVFDSEIVTNRRQVRVEPAFPLRGQAANICYRATEGPLAAANPVYIHLGQDAFTNAFADVPMTWNATTERWEYPFIVPASALGRLAFVFHDPSGTNWHNNYTNDWQALLGRASVSPTDPVAGSDVTLRYEADMGPLAGTTQVLAWVACDGGDFPATNGVRMTNTSGARWESTVPVPAHARSLSLAFSSGNGWDDDYGRTWTFPVSSPTARAWPPAPIVAEGSPVITGNPTGAPPNNVGDNFDLAMGGPPLVSKDALPGFGDWGAIWLNADATNLYLGGYGAHLGGTNNVLILFLGLDTLTDNAWNLWHKSGLPNALDFLHNLRFTEPMDVAIVLGNQYGDGPAYTNFTHGGYNFGQGVYYLGTNSGVFVPMGDARLSQFGGEGTTPCATGGDAADQLTTRWEVALPWSALKTAGPEAASNLFVGGVIASDSVVTNDRYVSRTYLGDHAWGAKDDYGQYGHHTVTLRPLRVNFPHGDLRGDGIANGWRQEYFGTPDGPPAEEDSDGDGQDNGEEEIAGTHPLDAHAFFALDADWPEMRWPFAPGRAYDVFFTPDMLQPFAPVATGLATNGYEPDSNGFYRVQVRK
jgi:acid phosphatase type 7